MLPQINILGLKVNPLSMSDVVSFVEARVKNHEYARILTLNAEIAYLSYQDPEKSQIINSADLVTPDGSGILWASEHYGSPIHERVSGIDLLQALLKLGQNGEYRFYFLGARPEVVEAAVENVKKKYPNITLAGYHDGYFDEEEAINVAADVEKSKADILFVAMGFPRQDLWMNTFAEKAGVHVAIGVGGSFDVLSGMVKRAPAFWQKMRMEWFYRLMKDPSRYKRVLALPKYMSAVKKDIKNK